MSGRADWSQVCGEIEAIAEAGRVDARKALLQKFRGLGRHIEINVLGLRAVHFADDGAGYDVARSEFLRFGVTLHEAFESDVTEDAALAAKSLGEKETRCVLNGESRGMKLHELHVRKNGAGFVGDRDAVPGSDFWVSSFAIDLAEASGSEKNGVRVDLVKRAVGFVDKSQTPDAAIFQDQASGEGVGAEVKVRKLVCAGEECAANFATRRIAVGVKNTRAAVSGFASKGEFGPCAIEFGAPLDELADVLGAFFDEQSDRFGAAEAVTGVKGVLLVESDFVFVAEGDGDAALRPGGRGIAEIGFGEDEDASGGTEFDRGAQAGNSGTDDDVVSVVGLWGRGHGRLRAP